jgi:ubiquitin carboxyl-terminal hydrolase 36/42
MHEAWLKGRLGTAKPPRELATTTFVHRIFGGRLRSQIKCEGVNYESCTYDPFLDLSLEINQVRGGS